MANNLEMGKKVLAVSMLAEGASIRAIERITGVHRDTIMRLGVRVGEACAKIQDATFRGLSCNQIECDEIWGFVGAKRKIADSVGAYGDVWTFIGLDSESKLIPSFVVGKRDAYHAKRPSVAHQQCKRVWKRANGPWRNSLNAVENNAYIQGLVKAILHLHEADATWVETVPVREVFNGRTIWEGPVEVFALSNHPKAKRCFAWSYKDGAADSEDKFVAVLEIPPVKSAQDAVKVAIAHEVRESQRN